MRDLAARRKQLLPLILSSISIVLSTTALTWTIYTRSAAVAWQAEHQIGTRYGITNVGRRAARGVRWRLDGRVLVGAPTAGPCDPGTGELQSYSRVEARANFPVQVGKSSAAETLVLTVTWRPLGAALEVLVYDVGPLRVGKPVPDPMIIRERALRAGAAHSTGVQAAS